MGGGYQPKSNSESQTGGEFNFLGHQGFFSSPRCLKSPPKTCFLESGSRSRKGLSPSAPQVVLSPPHPALHRPLMMWGLPVLSRGLESLLWMAQPMPRVQHAQCTGQTRADPSPMGMPAGGPFKTYWCRFGALRALVPSSFTPRCREEFSESNVVGKKWFIRIGCLSGLTSRRARNTVPQELTGQQFYNQKKSVGGGRAFFLFLE